MELNEFARNRKHCYTTGNEFLFWKISHDGSMVPCLLEGVDSCIIAHIVVFEGENDGSHRRRTVCAC